MITDDRLRQLRDTTAIDSVSYLEIRQMAWELIAYRDTKQGGGAAPPANEPEQLDISAQINRLSQGLVDNHNRLNAAVKGLNERIGQVVEIIGARIDGLAEAHEAMRGNLVEDRKRLDALIDMLGESSRSPSALHYATRIAQLADAVRDLNPGWGGWKNDAPFPTGGASTAEAATDAVLPVPQRGDQVTLNGATTVQDRLIPPGLYSVVGQDGEQFQIVLSTSGAGSILVWVRNDSYGLQGITHDVD